ncbi:MAG: ABC transporter permease [Anaerolinea sp.]|nr:ABC transporter permease [Anaerolinea sp.]
MTGMRSASIWLRWSWRDLKGRWPQVLAIALVIGLGTGSYSGLSSVTRWRETSSNAAYARLNMHDLRVQVAQAGTVPAGSLLAALQSIPDPGRVTAAAERLSAEIQVDASSADRAVIVPGRLLGQTVEPAPTVDTPYLVHGAPLTAADAGQPRVLLERNFANYYDLPPAGTLRLSGGQRVDYTGHALTPEYFIVTDTRGGFLGEANYAVVFTSLETAQDLLKLDGAVNELVLTVAPGTDLPLLEQQLEQALAAGIPASGFTFTPKAEEPSFRINDRDIQGDQQMYNIFAVLIFGGAVVAAFNLIARMVESQRREIGVAMVIGLSPAQIAVRPMLVAAEIALLGVVFGVAVGAALGSAMAGLYRDLMPLPEWDTSFQFALFARIAAGGFLIPFLATLWPIWRAVTVSPVEAIRASYRLASRGGLAPLLRKLHLAGNTFAQMPVRNVLRSPRRTALTGVGIAAAVAIIIALVGMIDSFFGTIDRADQEMIGASPARLEVQLEAVRPAAGSEIAAIRGMAEIAQLVTGLRLEAALIGPEEEIPLRLEVMDFPNTVWTPRLSSGQLTDAPGIYLSELAARNLGVGVGDTVRLRHPVAEPGGGFRLVERDIKVLGLHPQPFRFIAFMQGSQASEFGLAGQTNFLYAVPAPGVTVSDAKLRVFEVSGVASAVGVRDSVTALREALGQFTSILRVVEFAVLLLALLVAFNAASINADERTTEIATMFAFGVPVRTVMRMAIVENFLLGVGATIAGVGLGWVLLLLIIRIRIPEMMPDIDIVATVSATTLTVSVALGVLAVAAAPLLTLRRLRNMDVPAALKIAE